MSFDFKDIFFASTKKRFQEYKPFFYLIFKIDTQYDQKIFHAILQIITETSILLHDKLEPLDKFKNNLSNITKIEVTQFRLPLEQSQILSSRWDKNIQMIIESYQAYCFIKEYIYGRKLSKKLSRHSITLEQIQILDQIYPNAKQYISDPTYRLELYCFFYSNPDSFKYMKEKQQYAIVQRLANWANYLNLSFVLEEMVQTRKIPYIPREPFLRYIKAFWSLLLETQGERFGKTKLKYQSSSRINYCKNQILSLIEREEGNYLSPLDKESMKEFKDKVISDIDLILKFMLKTKKILV